MTHSLPSTIPTLLRSAAQEVTASAVHARPSAANADAAYMTELAAQPAVDSWLARLPDRATREAFVIVRDAINFGSGYHPTLAKMDGLSGARSIGQRLFERVRDHGIPSPAALATVTPRECAELFRQPLEGPAFELMTMFAQAWNGLGRCIVDEYRGEYGAAVEAADGQATRMVDVLARIPCWSDVSSYRGTEVPFFKRAQLAAYGLSLCGVEREPSRITGIERLTAFADNLIPHVLVQDGLIEESRALREMRCGELLLEHGGEQEVELRAAAVVVCDHLSAVSQTTTPLSAVKIAALLWKKGQQPQYKASPRPRTRTFAY